MTTTTQRMCVLLFLMILLPACASNAIYRNEFTLCKVSPQQTCESHSIQHYNEGTKPEYLLGFVEINDQGQLRDRAQMDALLSELQNMSAQSSLLINVFVHGWHHNAKPGDPNIESFKDSLKQLSTIENKLHEGRPRKVVGVYVGWRGESIDILGIRQATFWDRKNTAQKVGQFGMSELLLRLEKIRNDKNMDKTKLQSRLVIVGHSFGGAAVYRATAQILADRFVDKGKGFGDLVVLLNPAFEALSFAPLYDLANADCSDSDNQLPKLVVLTSEADRATKYLFPIGRSFSTLFEAHGPTKRDYCKFSLNYKEGEADRNTVGHFKPFLTHALHPGSKAPENDLKRLLEDIRSQHKLGGTMQFRSTELVSLDKKVVRSPYLLNVTVDEALIKDHNDVFGEKIVEFLRILILLSTSDK